MALESFRKFNFFRNPSVSHGMGLGARLVTIEHPFGPTYWLLGPCSPGVFSRLSLRCLAEGNGISAIQGFPPTNCTHISTSEVLGGLFG